MDPKIYHFALIGHSGSGKTTFTAGLAATAAENFSIQSDMLTKKYVNDINTRLLNNSWPEPTSGEPTKLAFTIFRNKKKYQISFNDYPGGMIAKDCFFDKIVRTPEERNYPDGALLLINCAAKQLKDRAGAQAMQDELKLNVQELATHEVPTALVITAWDRISTQKDAQREFDKFLQPITECMSQQLKKWRRFNVTATGPLKDQRHPELNPDKLEEPFLWLLNQNKETNRGIIITREIIGWILIPLLLFAGGFALRPLLLPQEGRELQEDINKKNKKLQEIARDTDKALSENDEEKTENKKLKEEKATLKDEIYKLNKDLKNKKIQKNDLQQSIASLMPSNKKLDSENKILKKEKATLENKIDKLQSDLKNKEGQKNDLLRSIDSLMEEIRKLEMNRDELQHKKLLEENMTLKSDVGKLRYEVKKLNENKMVLEKKIEDLKDTINTISQY